MSDTNSPRLVKISRAATITGSADSAIPAIAACTDAEQPAQLLSADMLPMPDLSRRQIESGGHFRDGTALDPTLVQHLIAAGVGLLLQGG